MAETITAPTVGIDLQVVEELEDFQKTRYEERDAAAPDAKAKEAYRDYEAEARATVKEFYRLNHQHQTFDFVQAKKAEYLPRTKTVMSIWQAMEFLNTLVDDSDPDTDLTQIEHLLQTAEATRADGHPRWFILTGLIHDLGKILCLWGEPQWAVVGDTFPIGCAYSEKVVFPEFFALNPDSENPAYQSAAGIYEPGAGLDTVHLSWGHDEYLYQVTRDHLPEESLYMIRYHSFYAAHREGAYAHLMNERDREMFRWVRAFNPYDLYSKTPVRPDVGELRPFYEELIAEYFPPALHW
jgi:inositol oxygenase